MTLEVSSSLKSDPSIFLKTAVEHHQKGELDKALQNYLLALEKDPKYFHTNRLLGALLLQMEQFDKAELYIQKALESDPENVELLNNLGIVFRWQNKLPEALALYERALELKPDFVEALKNCGNILADSKELKRAVDRFDEALKLKPLDSEATYSKARALLASRCYPEGWSSYEARFDIPYLKIEKRLLTPPWDGKSHAGKRLLIWSEQGFGDSIQFIRYAALCKQKFERVFVLCQRPLLRLFENIPFIDAAFETIQEIQFDVHIPMMSLPYRLAIYDEIPTEIPYLRVDIETAKKWTAKFVDINGFKVGLAWHGRAQEGSHNSYALRRNISLSQLLPLFETNAHFYTLQMGEGRKQIEEFRFRDRLTDYTNDIDDFMDTAALIQNLDLVITVDTSVAHLAGALGKPVWILSRYDACWRWLQNQEKSPWYPSARIFGQINFNDWHPVINNVKKELKKAS